MRFKYYIPKKKQWTKMKISTAQSRLEISRILTLIFNQKKISKLRFLKDNDVRQASMMGSCVRKF